jgi:hypothetical protein
VGLASGKSTGDECFLCLLLIKTIARWLKNRGSVQLNRAPQLSLIDPKYPDKKRGTDC